MTETPGGTAKNPTCNFSATYTGYVGYYAVPVPCAQAGDCASTPWSQFRSLKNQIEVNWKPVTPTSNPPSGFITVWVPTVFTSRLTINGGKPWAPTPGSSDMIMSSSAETQGLEAGRTLNIVIQLTTLPVAVEWLYTSKGAQSGKSGFSCKLYSPYPSSTSASASQKCFGPNPINAGFWNTSGNGYIFTHDATKLTVQARVLMQVSATAYFNTTQPYVEHLKTQRVWTLWSGYEHSIIQQVEGVTVP